MNYFELNGQYLYKLADPYRRYAYLPLGADQLATHLDLNYRTALKICKGQRALKKSELLLLQVIFFGLIPDKDFLRKGFFVQDGLLRTTRLDNYELSMGELFEYSVLKTRVLILQNDLAIANEKIRELTAEPEPTNIIKFSDYFRG